MEAEVDPELLGVLYLDKALDILVLLLALGLGAIMLHLLLRQMTRSMEHVVEAQVLLLRTAIEHSSERHSEALERVSSRVTSLSTQVAGHETRLAKLEHR